MRVRSSTTELIHVRGPFRLSWRACIEPPSTFLKRLVLLECALTLQFEIVALYRDEVKYHWCCLHCGKGKKGRVIPVGPTVLAYPLRKS